MIRSLGLPLLLLALACFVMVTSSCVDNENYTYNYSYELCKLDSAGTVTWVDLPATNPFTNLLQLIDGRLLFIRDSLVIYTPETKSLQHISKIDYPNNLDLSLDGNYCYFPREGKIIRLHLNLLSQQAVLSPAPGSTDKFSRPTISRDGRYLSALRGYGSNSVASISWIDLLTAEQYDFPGAYQYSFRHAWIEIGGTGIYYISSGNDLKRMGMQGAGDVTIRSGISWSYPSYDNRYLVCLNGEYQPRLVYRDNPSLTWYDTDINAKTRLCRGANMIYYFKDTRLWKMDIDSGQTSQLVSGSVGGKDIYSIIDAAPAWDGSDAYLLVSFRKKVYSKDKYPL